MPKSLCPPDLEEKLMQQFLAACEKPVTIAFEKNAKGYALARQLFAHYETLRVIVARHKLRPLYADKRDLLLEVSIYRPNAYTLVLRRKSEFEKAAYERELKRNNLKRKEKATLDLVMR